MAKLTYVTAGSLVLISSLIAASQANAEPSTSVVAQNNESVLIRNISRDPLSRPQGNGKVSQVTSVSELSDVQPTDWAFTALQSLVERYGCIEGYPDKTYRGQRSTSRYEFAAGLNACLDKINEIISAGLADKVSKDDLATLQRLQEEFAAELAALKGRVDALDNKVAILEKQQFSTTTKLAATVQFVPAFGVESTGRNGATTPAGESTNFVFSARVRLNFNTSFTGKDLLTTRLQFGNVTNFGGALGTQAARFAFDNNTNGNFQLDNLFYRFPIGEQLRVGIGVSSFDLNDTFENLASFRSSDTGALSRFLRQDPFLLRAQGSGAGIHLNYKPSDIVNFNFVYLANGANASSPSGQGGLTNGDYSAGVQVVFEPVKGLKLAGAYLRTFDVGARGGRAVDLSSGTSSAFSRNPFGNQDTEADRYGVELNWAAAKFIELGGRVSFIDARSASGPTRNQTADLISWAAWLYFPDLFSQGSAGQIIFGQNPRVTGGSVIPAATATNSFDRDTSYTLEVAYRYRVSRNISIQPGFFAVFNPENDERLDTIFVAALRTTFSF